MGIIIIFIIGSYNDGIRKNFCCGWRDQGGCGYYVIICCNRKKE